MDRFYDANQVAVSHIDAEKKLFAFSMIIEKVQFDP